MNELHLFNNLHQLEIALNSRVVVVHYNLRFGAFVHNMNHKIQTIVLKMFPENINVRRQQSKSEKNPY